MTRSQIVSEPDLAEYEKIRKHVIGQLLRTGGSSKRLASNRELAKKFGVTHPTVIKALRDLVSDGFLTIKPGIGTFTNPGRLHLPHDVKLIGVIVGDGKNVLTPRVYWNLSPMLTEAILGRSEKFQIQHSFLSSTDIDAGGIMKMGLDAILSYCPAQLIIPVLRELKEERGVPVLSFAGRVPGVSSFYFDFETDNCNVADKMLEEGRRKIVLALPEDDKSFAKEAIAGVQKAFAKRNLQFDNWVFVDLDSSGIEFFDKFLEETRPDGIIFNFALAPFMDTIKKRVDIVDGCRLYSGSFTVFRDLDYFGYIGVPDFSADAELAADNLIAQLESPDKAEVLSIPIKMDIKLSERKGWTP